MIGGTEWVAICGGGAWYKTTRVIRGEEQVVPKICRTESKRWGWEGDGALGIKIFGQSRFQTTVASVLSVPDQNGINNIHKHWSVNVSSIQKC